MSRGFQNTPNTCILLKYEGAMAFQNKAWFVGISSKKCAFSFGLIKKFKLKSLNVNFSALPGPKLKISVPNG